ncbi:hypothetical protein [Streptomyces sp. H27-C3]|uniref:hypothetical protein n=1 Tax=Streptomyces sp. H27-C3 TaxID=3046305 RepID=UPI0024BAFAC8|nr:hypothetical protein [Streptomyces sp. H27-C3]MDJ0460615.1 hypothetical protein [Streptomyces sp. H27-C3]
MSVQNEATDQRRAAVYRLWDTDGNLLYIGSAYSPGMRAKAHRAKPWWPLAVRRTDEWHPSREAAYVAETVAIEQARPPGNKISGPGAVAVPAQGPKATRSVEGDPLLIFAELDDLFRELEAEPPAVRFRKLTEIMESLEAASRSARRLLIRQMRGSSMTYRGIAKEMGISFGRVRQILAEEPDQPSPGAAE